jgi:hypothetical protein
MVVLLSARPSREKSYWLDPPSFIYGEHSLGRSGYTFSFGIRRLFNVEEARNQQYSLLAAEPTCDWEPTWEQLTCSVDLSGSIRCHIKTK